MFLRKICFLFLVVSLCDFAYAATSEKTSSYGECAHILHVSLSDEKAQQSLLNNSLFPAELFEQLTLSERATLLCSAVSRGWTKTTEFFLSKGWDVNSHASYGSTPLTTAISKENTAMVEFLLSKGADASKATLYEVPRGFGARSKEYEKCLELINERLKENENIKITIASPSSDKVPSTFISVASLESSFAPLCIKTSFCLCSLVSLIILFAKFA